jgi:cobalt-zinc-cadmium efflux system membrane fusion protein
LLTWSCKSNPSAEADTPAREAVEPARPAEVIIDEAAQQKAGIVVEQPRSQASHDVISATGRVTYNEDRSWIVGSVVDGRVVSVLVKAGERVSAGQVLAQVHSHEVHDSRADYRNAVREVTRAQTVLAQAQRVRDRARRLFELKAMSREQLEHAELEYSNAVAAVERAKVEVEKQRVHLVEFLEVPAEETAHRPGEDQDFVPVKAPASGLIVQRLATAGSAVSAGEQLFRIADTSALWVIANVNEADLSHLRPGQPVRIAVRAYSDRKFSGRVLRLGEQLDPETRTLRVHVVVPNQHGLLKPEMFAATEFDRADSRPAVVIPDSAVQDLSGHQVVFVRVAANRFAVRPIQTVSAGPGHLEVVDGLRPADAIVVKGAFVLKSHLLRSSLEEE